MSRSWQGDEVVLVDIKGKFGVKKCSRKIFGGFRTKRGFCCSEFLQKKSLFLEGSLQLSALLYIIACFLQVAGAVLPTGEGLAQSVGRDREAVDVDEVLDGVLKGEAVVSVAEPVVAKIGEQLILHRPLDAWSLVATRHLLGRDPVPRCGVALLREVGGAGNQELEVPLIDRHIGRPTAERVEDLDADERREREANGVEFFTPIFLPKILGNVVFYLYSGGHGSLIWFETVQRYEYLCNQTNFCATKCEKSAVFRVSWHRLQF